MSDMTEAEVEIVARAIWEARRVWARARFHDGIELEEWGDGSFPKANGIMGEARAALKAAAQAREGADHPRYAEISQTIDGDWRTPSLEQFHRACCDCGLVHKEEYRLQNGRVQYRVTRDREETRLERERTGKNAAVKS